MNYHDHCSQVFCKWSLVSEGRPVYALDNTSMYIFTGILKCVSYKTFSIQCYPAFKHIWCWRNQCFWNIQYMVKEKVHHIKCKPCLLNYNNWFILLFLKFNITVTFDVLRFNRLNVLEVVPIILHQNVQTDKRSHTCSCLSCASRASSRRSQWSGGLMAAWHRGSTAVLPWKPGHKTSFHKSC